MTNSLLCTRWIYGKCAKMKRVKPGMAKHFICDSFKKGSDGEASRRVR